MIDQTPIICRTCDGCLGDCRGNNPGCPVTKEGKSTTMRRILVAYVITMAVIAFGLFQLWNNGS
jgi:hypothetical protein